MRIDDRPAVEGVGDGPLSLPTPPGRIVRPGFPMLATVAPVVLSLALFAVTRSPFALLFAVLGPVVALASLGDSARHGRRARRREQADFEADCARVEAEIAERHRRERERLDAAFPALHLKLAHPTQLWMTAGARGLLLGRGTGPSGLRVERAGSIRTGARARARLESLATSADRLENRPIIVDPAAGVGFRGDTTAEAAARAAVLQLAASLPPDRWSITVRVASTPSQWSWIAGLPHASTLTTSSVSGTLIDFVDRSNDAATTRSTAVIRVAVIGAQETTPRGIGHVVDSRTAALQLLSPGEPDVVVRGAFVTLGEASSVAALLRRAADDAGLVPAGDRLPHSVPFGTLPQRTGDPRSLACALGRDTGGIWTVDLVADGPHAAIGGTTGSGKSELLASWALALARGYTEQQVNLLLVDFKGGATFGPLTTLPHTVGLITDLDDIQARRALESLRAELLFRERTLAEAGVGAVELLPAGSTLPRLVIVVDEFAAVTGGLPDLHGLFVDLAARGRSLGIHLILCTQRPASTLRDSILANCTLRISLRVNDPADSVAVIGTGDAATLSRGSAGRALVSIGGDPPATVQVAIAGPADIASAAAMPSIELRRPWCDPLPSVLTRAALDARVLAPAARDAFGLLDLPTEQRQEAACWDPLRHGHVLVLGGYASGRSTAVRALVGSAGPVLPDDHEVVWDTVMSALRSLRTGSASPRVLGIDDLDALVARLGPEHRIEFIDALAAVLREGPAAGVFAVLSARQVPSALQALAAACDSRLILRVTDRAEHVVAGGRSSDFDERMPAGGGFWRGDRVQVLAIAPAARRVSPRTAIRFDAGGLSAVVTPTVSALRRRLAGPGVRVIELGTLATPTASSAGATSGLAGLVVAEHDEHIVLLGDSDAWQAAWTLLPAARARGRLVFHRCSVADYRAITRSRDIPPPLGAPDDQVWVLGADGTPVRADLPPRDEAESVG